MLFDAPPRFNECVWLLGLISIVPSPIRLPTTVIVLAFAASKRRVLLLTDNVPFIVMLAEGSVLLPPVEVARL
jgi:hypothetical protein